MVQYPDRLPSRDGCQHRSWIWIEAERACMLSHRLGQNIVWIQEVRSVWYRNDQQAWTQCKNNVQKDYNLFSTKRGTWSIERHNTWSHETRGVSISKLTMHERLSKFLPAWAWMQSLSYPGQRWCACHRQWMSQKPYPPIQNTQLTGSYWRGSK